MKKCSLLFIFLLTSLSLFSQTTLLKHDEKTIRLSFHLPEISRSGASVDGTNYTLLSYNGSRTLIHPGAPQIPYTLERIAVPPGAHVSVQFQITSQSEIQQINIFPASIVSGLKEATAVILNDSIYNSSLPYPEPIVEVSEPYVFRTMQVVDLKIYPVRFYPIERRVQLFNDLSIQLNIEGGRSAGDRVVISPTEKGFLKNYLLNFDEAQSWTVSKSERFQKTLANYDFSTGQWFKIPVTQEGVYRITGSFLAGQGVNISGINIDQIQMFNYGGRPLPYNSNDSIPSDLNEIAISLQDNNGDGILDDDDAVYFYGRGVTGWNINPNSTDPHPWVNSQHPFATVNYYLLTFNQNTGKRIAVTNSIQQGSPIAPVDFEDHVHFEEDHINLLQSGPDWYWHQLSGFSDQTTINFTLPQNVAPGPMKVVLKFKGASSLYWGDPGGFHDTLDVSINGQKIVDNLIVTDNGIVNRTFTFSDLFAIHGGSNELFIRHNGNKTGASVAFDYIELYFQRSLQAQSSFLKINYVQDTNPTEYRISNLPASGNRIWEVSDFANVQEIIPLQNNSMVIFQDQAAVQTPQEYMVFGSSAVKTVQQIQAIENSPNLRDPNRNGKYLIITPDEFYDAAAELENFKEFESHIPFETERVKLSEIYREFSSCVADPTAIRNFIRYAYYNWRNPPDAYPEFVLLLGDGSYDYKGIALPNYVNRVPTFEIYGSYDIPSRESDNYYVALNATSTGDLDPQLALGRFPINSISEFESFMEKLKDYERAYLDNPVENGWQNILTFIADDEIATGTTETFHLDDTEDLVRDFVPSKFDLKKIYLIEYETVPGGFSRLKPQANEDFITQINQGTLMINFFGHGNPDTWAHEQVFTRSRDLNKIDNESKLPLWVAATCTWGRFDDPTGNSMAEEMFWLRNKGGIGVIAASRPVFAGSNDALVRRLYQNLFNNRSNTQTSKILGTALLHALGGGDNDQKFRLMGDPTMKLADAENLVSITSVTPDTLKALSTVEVTARVTDAAGNPLTSFKGDALIRVFDTKDTVFLANYSNTTYSRTYYTKQEKTIFKGLVSIDSLNNGEFTAKFIVPKSIKYDDTPTGRISIYAWSDNMGTASGFRNDLILFGTESLTDNHGPEIDFSFEGQEDFFDGDYVTSQPTVIIGLFDSSGINLTQEVGHRIELSIDGNIRKDVTQYFVYDKNSYRSGQLRYTLPALAPGNHALTISAWDNVNNLSEQEVNFRTIQINELALEEVVNYPNPFADDTHFTFQFQSPTNFGDVTIKIYTVTGRLIQQLETVAQPGFNKLYWDGRDRDGDKLANGVYLYKIIVNDGQRKIEKIEKLAVLR